MVYFYSILSFFFITMVSKLRLTEVRVTLDFDSFLKLLFCISVCAGFMWLLLTVYTPKQHEQPWYKGRFNSHTSRQISTLSTARWDSHTVIFVLSHADKLPVEFITYKLIYISLNKWVSRRALSVPTRTFFIAILIKAETGKQSTRCYSTSTLWQLKMGLTQKEIEKNKVVWLVESMVRVALPCSWHAFPHSPTYCTTNWHFDPFASRFLLSDLIIGTLKTWEWKDESAVSNSWLCFSRKTHTKQDFGVT